MNKLDTLLNDAPKNTVILDSWLKKHLISNSLKQKYLQYGWLRSIGRGASYLKDNPPDWQGAISAMQEAGINLHVGGKTALQLQGTGHFIAPKLSNLYLYEHSNQRLPSWFLQYDWQIQIHYCNTAFIPVNLGIQNFKTDNGTILRISTTERAILELLYLVPKAQGIEEAYYIIENLNSLQAELLQELLESCHSIKVRRLFFCLSERAGHSWVKLLNKEKIDFGSGKRHIVTGGYLDPAYNITLPKSWRENEEPVF